MDKNFFIYILMISLFSTFLSTPKVKKLGKYLNIVEQPKIRGQKTKPMVRSGGISMVISTLFVCLFLIIATYFNFFDFSYLSEILKISLICFSFFFVGLIDDLLQISPWIKLIAQIVGASVITSLGMISETIIMPAYFGSLVINLPTIITIFLNIIFIVSMINAINWLDGLDGLASGFGGIISSGFFVLGWNTGNLIVCIISLINIGFCLGFLKYNYYPAKIFMGDCGSYFLGANISLMSIILLKNNGTFLTFFSIFLLLLYPLFDMAMVIFKRLKNKRSPFIPGREHFHHLMIDNGFTDEESVLFLYLITSFLTISAVSIINNNLIILFPPFLIFTLFKLKQKIQKI